MHPICIIPVLAQSNAEQDIVCVVIVVCEEVRVVGGNDGQSEFGTEGENLCIEPGLAARVMRLNFEVVAILKDLGVPACGGAGFVPAVVLEMGRDLAGEAGGTHHQSFGVSGKQLAIHPGARVEAFGVSERGQFDEVLVAGAVAGEEHEVIVGSQPGTWAGLQSSVTCGDVRFHADNGAETRFPCLLLKLPRGVHVAVVRDREGRLLEFRGASDEIIDAVRAIEQ